MNRFFNIKNRAIESPGHVLAGIAQTMPRLCRWGEATDEPESAVVTMTAREFARPTKFRLGDNTPETAQASCFPTRKKMVMLSDTPNPRPLLPRSTMAGLKE